MTESMTPNPALHPALKQIPAYRPIDGTVSCFPKFEYERFGMFCLVTWRWITPLAEWLRAGNCRCLEVMAGRGWLSAALQHKGVPIHATDDYSWFKDQFEDWSNTVTVVEKIDAVAAVEKYGPDCDILIMAWPPYDQPIGYEVLRKMYLINPETRMIFIGEGEGGCTADDAFHHHFDPIENDEKFNHAASCYERWYGMHDYINLGRYKP